MYILSECKVRTGYCTPRCGPTRACFIFQPTGYKGLHSIRTAERKSKVKVIVVEKGGWKGRGNMCSSCIIHIPGFPKVIHSSGIEKSSQTQTHRSTFAQKDPTSNSKDRWSICLKGRAWVLTSDSTPSRTMRLFTIIPTDRQTVPCLISPLIQVMTRRSNPVGTTQLLTDVWQELG